VDPLNPVIEAVNTPACPAEVAFDPAMVGLIVVDQQTPLSVRADPPIVTTVPLPVAVVAVIFVVACVVTVAKLSRPSGL